MDFIFDSKVLFAFSLFLVIATIIHMLYHRRDPTSIISWVLFLIFLPFIGVIVYFLISKKKVGKEEYYINLSSEDNNPILNDIDAVLRGNDIPSYSKNNKIISYTNSQKAFEKLLELIDESKKRISLCTYVFGYDDTSKILTQKLIEKVKEGVEVRLLIDAVGSFELHFLRFNIWKMRRAGVKVAFFMPLLRLPHKNYINLRNHRKIYMFDDCKVLTGGMNLSSDYIGPKSDKDTYEDILFYISGNSVYSYFKIFEADWYYATGEKLNDLECLEYDEGKEIVQVVPSGANMFCNPLNKAILTAIFNAKKRIWLVTPYFIPYRDIIQALIIAQNRGIDVRLITPKDTDSKLVDYARLSFMRDICDNGVDVYLYKGNLLHAKSILFDDEAVMLGSVNIDNRSLFINYEVAAFAYSNQIIDDVEKWMQKLMDDSDMFEKEASKIRMVAENGMRLFAPVL